MTDTPRTVPKQSLAYLFPLGFNEFWAKTALKQDLETIKYDYIPATTDKEEVWKSLLSGYGMNAVFIAKYFFDRYHYRTYEPHDDDFMAQFRANTIYVITEVRRKEWLWQDTFRQIKNWTKKLNLTTDLRTSKNYDNTKIDSGNIINKGSNTNQTSEQKQTSSQSVPIFANVDLTSGTFGGFQRQSQLSDKQTEQGQNIQAGSSNRTTSKQNLTHKEFYRQNKDANVSITKQEAYELNSVSRLLNNFSLTIINLSEYHKLFDRLFIKFFGATVVPIICEKTGRRKWVSEAEYEEIITEETGKPKILEGNEWDENLPYLERLKILLSKTEKEYNKLPDTSNRKPRIALRLKNLEGCLKAYEPKYIELPTPELFLKRINGEIKGYTRVIGYENIIEIVAKYLKSYHFAAKYGTPPPAQLMIMLLGEPGLGKTYISQAIAKALGRGFHMVGMNGKLNASLITGTNIENPGAEPGEVLKAIARKEDRGCVIVFDEIEKAARECKEACGIPTDITTNGSYQDTFLDFPTPTNECIFIATVNRPEDVPSFVADRFAIRVEVLPLAYEQRLEVVRVVLQSELRKLEPAFEKIYHKKWEEVYSLFDHEELLKKTLTWTFSIRGAKNNVLLKLIPTLTSDFLVPERGLPNRYEMVNYEWGFLQREGKDENCPYAKDKRNKHKENCMCFVRNLEMVPGWREEMGENYNETELR